MVVVDVLVLVDVVVDVLVDVVVVVGATVVVVVVVVGATVVVVLVVEVVVVVELVVVVVVVGMFLPITPVRASNCLDISQSKFDFVLQPICLDGIAISLFLTVIYPSPN